MSTVTFYASGQSFQLPDNSELMEIENTSQRELDFGCRAAGCGTCAIEIIAGLHNLNAKNDDEEDMLDRLDINGHNRRLACQCRVHGDITIKPLN
ncbi:2Fe-2S iron-sulfur cluster-binding protein [Veronia pacifica]|uniref:Ferredoxin n=1 Tax=Veronia pacifica TaxID=1080227 RepID=A0A1C3ECP1_9GAMM|nr:2Fe-2S iron-sulfur cluster-binding protein [Veronia pacifica]ODA31001.1 ferredoxin [Veronia pacifica]